MADPFAKLAAAYKDKVYSFALYSLKRQDEAEDVTQEVLIKLWKHHETVEPERLTAWVMRVARNAVIDASRRRKSRASVIAEEVDLDIAANYAASDANTESRVHSREFSEALESALAKLDEPYRSIVLMREVQQFSYNEIVDTLDMPLNTVKVYLHRARRALRDALKGTYEEDAI